MLNDNIRWVQRFENLSKACVLLGEIEVYDQTQTLPIIREGFIQRFEITFELAWKTLKDYLTFDGIDVRPTPREVIKEAFGAELILDGQVFIDMLEARNLMTHRYDEETFQEVYKKIKLEFYPALNQLCEYLRGCIK